MRMPGKLQGNPRFLGDEEVARLVDQQYAGPLTVQRGLLQKRPESRTGHRIPIMHAHNLQTVQDDYFVRSENSS